MPRLMPLSFRAQLTLVLVAFSLVLTSALGWVAYRTSQGIIEREAIRAVGIAANAREQALLQLLRRQVDHADNFLRIARLSCLGENPGKVQCLKGLLEDFKLTEGATEARLEYRDLVAVGADASVFSEMPSSDQLANFVMDDKGHASYLLHVTSENREASVSLVFPVKTIAPVFSDRYGLGQSGETFLTDTRGYFITPSRDPAHSSGQSHPIESASMRSCLEGHNGEMLERDYREVDVVHGFRYVKEIGGGCIMAHLDQSEAFAPAHALRTEVTAMSAMFAAFAMVLSFALARSLAQPIVRLTARARALQAGDFASPVPMDGPLEVRTFAGAFASMAQSLNESRTALLKSEQQQSTAAYAQLTAANEVRRWLFR